jgi:RimJ/RimL family protein N-acetyltransferase
MRSISSFTRTDRRRTRPLSDMTEPITSLRPVADSDMEAFFEFAKDLEARDMAAFTSDYDPGNRVAFDSRWQRLLANDEVTMMAIATQEGVVGNVGSFVMGDERHVTYWIDRAAWGRGIATAALAAFLELDTVRPIFAGVAADNAGSIRVLEKCGFAVVDEATGFANARGREIAEYVMRLG